MTKGLYERTPEIRAKISKALMGNRNAVGYVPTPEHRAKLQLTSAGNQHRRTHGLRYHPLYKTWIMMRQRCNNSRAVDYKYYGGRGITVCERWSTFVNFLGDMGERPDGRSLDRIDNDGNYEPGNCRWATRNEQRANQRNPLRETA